jgi:hypothetical protein
LFTRKGLHIFFDLLRSNNMIKVNTELIAQGAYDGYLFACYVETKADFDFNNMTRAAVINIKWTFQRTGRFVNLVKVPTIFKNTFCPKAYIADQVYVKGTNKGKSKIKFPIKTLADFLNEHK